MAAILGTAMAPAVVRAASLMPVRAYGSVVVPAVFEPGIVVMTLADGVNIHTLQSAVTLLRDDLHVGDVVRLNGRNAVVTELRYMWGKS
jgi:hypothetical protein